MNTNDDRTRLDELLADRALGVLEATDERELERLLQDAPDADDESFERAAAALQLALLRPPLEPLPVDLQARIARSARMLVLDRSVRPERSRPAAFGRLAWTGWAVAAAALALAYAGLLPLGSSDDVRELGVVARLEALRREARDLIEQPWGATEDALAQGVEGDVVWSNELQSGFMRFRGLAANDPTVNQYQLWIFDADRPSEHPVDGGVFDIPSGASEVVVPIDARLDIAQPTLFAVTLERPGGVVVSTRERLLLAASVP